MAQVLRRGADQVGVELAGEGAEQAPQLGVRQSAIGVEDGAGERERLEGRIAPGPLCVGRPPGDAVDVNQGIAYLGDEVGNGIGKGALTHGDAG